MHAVIGQLPRHVYIRLQCICNHGCEVTACLPVLFYKKIRNERPVFIQPDAN